MWNYLTQAATSTFAQINLWFVVELPYIFAQAVLQIVVVYDHLSLTLEPLPLHFFNFQLTEIISFIIYAGKCSVLYNFAIYGICRFFFKCFFDWSMVLMSALIWRIVKNKNKELADILRDNRQGYIVKFIFNFPYKFKRKFTKLSDILPSEAIGRNLPNLG